MARAASARTKRVGRPSSGRSAATKMTAAKQRPAPKVPVVTASASKEELRARVEKLERANATLRVKNKELRIVAVEAAEQVDALTLQLAKSEEHGVAPRMLASGDDLDRLATEETPDVPATQGWRWRMFGEDALALREGRIAIAARGKRIRLVRLESDDLPDARRAPSPGDASEAL
jgi:hypothetical protein